MEPRRGSSGISCGIWQMEEYIKKLLYRINFIICKCLSVYNLTSIFNIFLTMMQPNTLGPSSQPQTQQIMIAPAFSLPINNPQRIQNYKSVLRSLGITEVILGVLSIILGIIIIATFGRPCYYGYCGVSIGEGIWCGIWIIIAGGLGIPCGKNNSSKCLINTHMAFSIVGAVFSGVLFSLAVIFALVEFQQTAGVVMFSILSLVSFASMVILIVSACYCCVVQGSTCCSQADVQPLYCGQMVCAQQPLVNQQLQGNQPLVVQFHQPIDRNQMEMQPVMMQPVMMQPGVMQPGVMQPCVMQQTSNVNDPYSQNMQSNQKEVPQKNVNAGYSADVPPAYNNYLPA